MVEETRALRARKVTLQEMEEFLAGVELRLSPVEGQSEFTIICAFRSEERHILESMRRFITWLIPYEPKLREIGAKQARRR